MAQRGDSKAMNLSAPTVVTDTRRKWPCPHPYCFEFIFGHRRDLMDHVQDKHKCGRCNHGRHHKCKKDICPCSCRWGDMTNSTMSPSVLGPLMEMMVKRPKVDSDKLNHDVHHHRLVAGCNYCGRKAHNELHRPVR